MESPQSPANVCQEISESLDAFRDDELSATERVRVQEHLVNCCACARRLDEIDSVVKALRTLPRVQMDADASARLDAILLKRKNRTVLLRPKIWMPVAAAAAVVALVGGIKLMNHESAPQIAEGIKVKVQSPSEGPTGPAASVEKIADSALPNTSVPRQEAPIVRSDQTGSPSDSSNVQPRSDLADHKSVSHSQAPVLPKIHVARADEHKRKPAQEDVKHASEPQVRIAAVQASAATAMVPWQNSVTLDVAVATDFGGGGFNEAIGLATDEDGLYDIKM